MKVDWMYKVGIYLRVRKACMNDGVSVREAARVFGLHRDTVRKIELVLSFDHASLANTEGHSHLVHPIHIQSG